MHELALYRKYRPRKFSEVLGQGETVATLEKSAAEGKVSHAYLFVGSRGTGKTSVARIFAEAIGVSGNDLYEIDAASNRGIEDIKALRDGAHSLPFDSKYKVYIIDEAHMLSRDAWGALLKTLEEPPRHVIFILATTEAGKVPDTIISRCQVFAFRRASEMAMKAMLLRVAEEEGFVLEPSGAELLAILGDGSFRDALGALQKAISSVSRTKTEGKKVSLTREEVEAATGAPQSVLVNRFVSAVALKNLEEGLSAVREAASLGLDMKLYTKLIIQKFRLALVLKHAPGLAEEAALNAGEEDFKFLRDLLTLGKEGVNARALSALLLAYSDIDRAFISELPLELALIEIIN